MKKTNIIIKLAFIAICAFLLVQIVNVSAKLAGTARAKAAIRAEIAELEGVVADMEHKLENRDDDAVIEEIARTELGLVFHGERVFSD